MSTKTTTSASPERKNQLNLYDHCCKIKGCIN
jgi:hypothetical protein